MVSIREEAEKIKRMVKEGFDFENPTQKKIFFTTLLVLVASASFGIGRLSGLEANNRAIEIEFPKEQVGAIGAVFATTSEQVKTALKTSGKYVASKNGTKYHLPTCSGARRISDANKIWFDTKEEAEKSGYAPAGNCKGI